MRFISEMRINSDNGSFYLNRWGRNTYPDIIQGLEAYTSANCLRVGWTSVRIICVPKAITRSSVQPKARRLRRRETTRDAQASTCL